jgi:hypothetical protein
MILPIVTSLTAELVLNDDYSSAECLRIMHLNPYRKN